MCGLNKVLQVESHWFNPIGGTTPWRQSPKRSCRADSRSFRHIRKHRRPVQPAGAALACASGASLGLAQAIFSTGCCGPATSRHMQAKRQGECPGCVHDIIDSRDLKYFRNVCGYSFKPEDDRFAWRGRLRHGPLWPRGAAALQSAASSPVVCRRLLWRSGCTGAFGLLQVPIGLAWLEIVWFFRDPERTIPSDPEPWSAPPTAPSRTWRKWTKPDFPGGRALRISIFLSIFNVHVNRLPCSGRVVQVRYFPGAFLDARNPQSAVRNEQLWIDVDEATDGGPDSAQANLRGHRPPHRLLAQAGR